MLPCRPPRTLRSVSRIDQMVAENPTWGAPRIHGELLKLGFDVSEPTVSRWVRRAPRPPDPAKRWLTFLRNHREAIAAMDFFTVPTLTFGILYCFFIIGHDRRQILHHNVTRNPNSLGVALQLHEAWECGEQPERFLIFDRDAKFSADVVSTVKAVSSQAIRTAFRSPWQNGIPAAVRRARGFFQSLLLAAPSNGPHCLGSHAHVVGHLRRRLSLVKLAQDRGSSQHPRGLPPFVQHPSDLLPILLPKLDMHPMVTLHVHTVRPILSLRKYLNGYISIRSKT